MQHLLSATLPRAWARASRERKRSPRSRPISTTLLALHIVGVAVLVAASVVAIADQSARFVSGQEIVGVHEIPSFIADRVELPPGVSAGDPALEVAPASAGRPAHADPAARG